MNSAHVHGFMIMLTILFSACTSSNNRRASADKSQRPIVIFYDTGSVHPSGHSGGPLLVLWADGVIGRSPSLTPYSDNFQSLRLNTHEFERLERELKNFFHSLPIELDYAPGEQQIRITWFQDSHSQPEVRHVPTCFFVMNCPGRLSANQWSTWQFIRQMIEEAYMMRRDVGDEVKSRVKEFWQGQAFGQEFFHAGPKRTT